MNWQAVNFDWNQARAFLATVEEGSLSAAARALGLTQPTLGRQVAALEGALDVLLFERIGKSLVLTPSGLELIDHVRAMFDAASRMSLTASGQSQAIEGKIRITASDMVSAYWLPDAIKALRAAMPMVDIDIVAANDIRDLQLREADIAIRHVRATEPDLVAKLIGEATAHFYAATRYLDARGRPASLADMADHDFIGVGDTDRAIAFVAPLGVALTRRNFRAGTESGLVAWQMTRQGLGIMMMSDDVAAETDGIERLLPDLDPVRFPVWLIAHRELYTSRRIRMAYDILADFLTDKMKQPAILG